MSNSTSEIHLDTIGSSRSLIAAAAYSSAARPYRRRRELRVRLMRAETRAGRSDDPDVGVRVPSNGARRGVAGAEAWAWLIRKRVKLMAVIRDEVSRQIAATPESVWSLVADVTRTAEWSPTVQRVEWVGDASGPEIGARFRGHNRQSGVRWSRE